MSRELPTYAKAGGPPDDWIELEVIDPDGNQCLEVVEVNTAERWAVRYVLDENGNAVRAGDALQTEKVHGAWSLRWRRDEDGEA